MTIHYHGLPLTPTSMLLELSGRHVCISFATKLPGQMDIALRRMQSIMFDNGAFTIFRQGGKLDEVAYYEWLDGLLCHPHWAVVPDVIDGEVEEQRALAKTWPFPRELGAPVWHLGLPVDYLLELSDEWPRICLGSSGQYWKVGSQSWQRRMDEATEQLSKRRRHLPWLHGLRMMAQAGKRWPLASVDSVNVARNFKSMEDIPLAIAHRLDRQNNTTLNSRRLPVPSLLKLDPVAHRRFEIEDLA